MLFKWLKDLLNKPEAKETIPEFDMTGVKYKIVYNGDIQKAFNEDLATSGTIINELPDTNDRQYMLYDKATVLKVYKLFPALKNHEEFLKDKFDKNSEGSDCDNKAEHNSLWFHRLLPGCAVISLSQPSHRFSGIVTIDAGIIWFNGNPASKDSVYDIIF